MNVETGYTQALMGRVKTELGKVVVNQDPLADLGLTALLAGGHLLLEGVPGLAKTLWVRVLARILAVNFKRVQFTSDLMPADILGTKVFHAQRARFYLKKGPLFTNLFLADEVNRTPPKTQSALLEVMEERCVTIDGRSHPLADPFMVLATQNPIEYEGTYPLPEALADRFMMKLLVTYPGVAAEKTILQMHHTGFETTFDQVETLCDGEALAGCRQEIRQVRVEESIMHYIISIVETTRRVNAVALGASPRGTVSLLLAAKARAAMQGRDFVLPEDIKDLAPAVLRHRVLLKPEAEMDGLKPDAVIENILAQVKVPR
jgi:MoxR-like ATPase